MGKGETYKDRQRNYQQRVIMKDLSQFSLVYLIPLADLHIGCRQSAVDIIRGYLDWIKTHANAFTILNGDLMNCATKDSTPELYEDLITPDEEYKVLRQLLLPIKDKILMITRGGHEEAIFRRVGCDYMARLAYDLGDIDYRPDGGMVGMKLTRNNHSALFKTYATHGWGGARTIGAKVKKSEDLAIAVDADCYVLSHDHTQNIHRLNYLSLPKSHLSCKKPVYLRKERKLLINTGGFIEYSGYIQRKGYSPQDIGTPRVRMELKNTSKGAKGYYKDLHASI